MIEVETRTMELTLGSWSIHKVGLAEYWVVVHCILHAQDGDIAFGMLESLGHVGSYNAEKNERTEYP